MSDKPALPEDTRADFKYFVHIPTRWMDNDVYGHVNNVVYYAWFDTVINRYLVESGGLDIASDPAIGVCVESKCRYLRSVAFPDFVDVAMRVGHIGRSSVRYELSVFREGNDALCATGHFVHVFVDRVARTPVALPEKLRVALERLRRG